MKNKTNILQKTLVAIVITFSILSLLAYFYKFHNGLSSQSNDWSAFGSYFGGIVNTSLTIIAIVYIFKTYNLQSNSFYINGFESNLFKMIDIHHKITDRILDQNDSFSKYRTNIDNLMEKSFHIPNGDGSYKQDISFYELTYKQQTEFLIQEYDHLYISGFYKISHYFRSLYNIFKYIDEDKYITEYEKIKYAKIIRSQLSHDETILIGLNSLTDYGHKFIKYLKKFELLHNIYNSDQYRAILIYNLPSECFGDEDIENPLPKSQEENMEIYEKLVTEMEK